MKLLYKQTPKDSVTAYDFGFENCYLKKITQKKQNQSFTKAHWHNFYEIHMIFSGKQAYEMDGILHELKENDYIIISPKIMHKIVYTSENLVKYSITFHSSNDFNFSLHKGNISESIVNSIDFIEKEFALKKYSSLRLIENRIFETLILLFRMSGYQENVVETEITPENHQLALAKKFIADNVEFGLSVLDVANYCHISSRHLTRLFQNHFGLSPAAYICNTKMNAISSYLINSDLSLREISEKFAYSDEHYFNTSFKKYFGIPPLAYRKMHQANVHPYSYCLNACDKEDASQ